MRHAAATAFRHSAVASARNIRFCIGKFGPDGGVIACPLAAPHIAIDLGRDQAVGDGRAQQKMIDAQPGVMGSPPRPSLSKGTEGLGMLRKSAAFVSRC